MTERGGITDIEFVAAYLRKKYKEILSVDCSTDIGNNTITVFFLHNDSTAICDFNKIINNILDPEYALRKGEKYSSVNMDRLVEPNTNGHFQDYIFKKDGLPIIKRNIENGDPALYAAIQSEMRPELSK